METTKEPLGKDISCVTAAFVFFLYNSFLASFIYILNIFL